ncbi:DUF1769-domain-containing protein [Macrolepiota fuliginosa MF-IS2]|uniref:DUF1769-domain-containing protein n=1 Tax=Macrolepiota fuliginosa MF-IS2 TaxID=1400762 RepID=A0A9P5XIT1_9AGAR|nr:DUF1769-domain-containing protein [Macrolepiota fuliginosa MF-IS2]
MTSKLRVMAGTSPETMVPITSIVNTNKSYKLSSDLFEGEIVAHIKNFVGEDGNVRESEYFAREDRQGITWSIQVRGRFLKPYSTDDILFGNTFDQPLKLPWGIGAVFKFMNYIDPTLEHDLQSNTKPWALSPLVSTMPHLQHQRAHDAPSPLASDMFLLPEDEPLSTFPSTRSIIDSTFEIYKTRRDRTPSSGSSVSSSSSSSSSIDSTASNKSNATSGSNKLNAIKGTIKKVTQVKRRKTSRAPPEMCFENAAARRSYFSNAANRQATMFGPSDIITTDFCYGFIEFSPSLALRLPGGLSFDLMRYWGGQPVRFVCCERKETAEVKEDDGAPWGRIFWCISIEVYEDDQAGRARDIN